MAKWQKAQKELRRKVGKEKLPCWPKAKGFQFHHLPADQLEALATLAQYPALAVLCVLSRLWFKNSRHNPITLTTQSLLKLGLSRYQKRRALSLLKKSGLISMERKSGKNPQIILNWRPQ